MLSESEVSCLKSADALSSAVDATSVEHFIAAGFDVNFVGPDESIRMSGADSGGVSKLIGGDCPSGGVQVGDPECPMSGQDSEAVQDDVIPDVDNGDLFVRERGLHLLVRQHRVSFWVCCGNMVVEFRICRRR